MPEYTLQLTSSVGKDSSLHEGAPTTKYGGSAFMRLERTSSAIGRPILYFDITAFTNPSWTISAATFSIYYFNQPQNDPSGITVWAYKLTRDDWVEADVTWNRYNGGTWTGGTYTTSNPSGGNVGMPGSINNWVDFNVKDIVVDAIDNVSRHVNLLVKFATESGTNVESQFRSREHNSEFSPKLVITWEGISESDTLSLSESTKGNLSSNIFDTLALSESSAGTDIGFTRTDTISLSDKLLQLWRRLRKHVSTWTHLTKNR